MTQLRLLMIAMVLTACLASPAPTATVQPTLAPPASTPSTLPTPAPSATSALTTAPTEFPSPVPATSSPTIPDGACCDFQLVADGLYRPTLVTNAGDDRLFILEQSGQIRVVVDGHLLAQPFLDIDNVVNDQANEQGLLGLAFHPGYAENGQFFVNYTDANGDTVVARYTVSADPDVADSDSAETLFTVDQPYRNHNGGGLAFGPDGLLYIGMGDGGSQGDPQGNGQNPYSFLGKMLRLDLDGAPDLIFTENNGPARLYRNADRQAHLVYARGARYVNDLRVVYEIQSRLRPEGEIPAAPEKAAPDSAPEKRPDMTDGPQKSAPRHFNRANDIQRIVTVLASQVTALTPRSLQ